MSQDDDKADVVDFDALHAALGDIPPPPTSSTPALGAADSSGKNNATYSSGRPHSIPPTRAPLVDMNAPSIVVALDEAQPTSQPNMPVAASQMTIPMGSPILSGVGAVSPGPMPVAGMRGPSASHPGFDGPRYPANDAVQQTMHMAGRPMAPPRRARSMTMVVVARGPSRKKKALVFIGMLLLVVGIGVAIFAFVRPGGVGLDGLPGLKPNAPLPVAPTTTIRRATTPVAPPVTPIPTTPASAAPAVPVPPSPPPPPATE